MKPVGIVGILVLSIALFGCAPDGAPPDVLGAGEGSETGAAGEDASGNDAPSASDDASTGGGAAEGDPIVIGGLFDQSGPTADIGLPYSQGVVDYMAWRNEQGGVAGRPIDLLFTDYQYDVAVAESFYSELVAAEVPAIIGWGTADTEALTQRVAEDEIPFLSGSLSAPLADPELSPYNFVAGVTYSDQMRITLDYIAEQTGGDAEVAFFHQDGPFGRSALADGEARAEELGLGFQSYPMPSGTIDFVAQVSQAEAQQPDYVYINNVVGPAAQLVRNLDEFGLEAQIVCWNFCSTEGLVRLAGGAAEGMIAMPMFGPGNLDVPGIEEPRQAAEAAGRSLDDDGVLYLQGWYYGALLTDTMEQMVSSGEELTGPAVRTALEEREPYETGGVSPAPIEFSSESHQGMDELRLFQVEDGQFVPLAEGLSVE